MKHNWIELIEKYEKDDWNCEIHFTNGSCIMLKDIEDITYIENGFLCNHKGKTKLFINKNIKRVDI